VEGGRGRPYSSETVGIREARAFKQQPVTLILLGIAIGGKEENTEVHLLPQIGTS